MFKFVLLAVALAVGFWIFQQTYPDFQRYMKIRSM